MATDIAKQRRKIAQLRALAASTTYPEEAKSARAKADKLEAELGSSHFAGPVRVPPPWRAAHGYDPQDPRSADIRRARTITQEEFAEMVRAFRTGGW